MVRVVDLNNGEEANGNWDSQGVMRDFSIDYYIADIVKDYILLW